MLHGVVAAQGAVAAKYAGSYCRFISRECCCRNASGDPPAHESFRRRFDKKSASYLVYELFESIQTLDLSPQLIARENRPGTLRTGYLESNRGYSHHFPRAEKCMSNVRKHLLAIVAGASSVLVIVTGLLLAEKMLLAQTYS